MHRASTTHTLRCAALLEPASATHNGRGAAGWGSVSFLSAIPHRQCVRHAREGVWPATLEVDRGGGKRGWVPARRSRTQESQVLAAAAAAAATTGTFDCTLVSPKMTRAVLIPAGGGGCPPVRRLVTSWRMAYGAWLMAYGRLAPAGMRCIGHHPCLPGAVWRLDRIGAVC